MNTNEIELKQKNAEENFLKIKKKLNEIIELINKEKSEDDKITQMILMNTEIYERTDLMIITKLGIIEIIKDNILSIGKMKAMEYTTEKQIKKQNYIG